MTDKLREAAQMALDALEHGLPIIEDFGGKEQLQLQHKAIVVLYEALRAALAQSEQASYPENFIDALRFDTAIRESHPEPEPVACPYCHYSHTLGAVFFDQNCAGCVKRMTAPPQREWQGLTDREYEAMAEKYVTNCYFDTLKYARAIEAKLKEKNNA